MLDGYLLDQVLSQDEARRDRCAAGLSGIVSQVGSKHLKLWDKAIISIANPASHGGAAHGNIGLLLERARRFNFMVPAFDTLLVFRKDEKRSIKMLAEMEALRS